MLTNHSDEKKKEAAALDSEATVEPSPVERWRWFKDYVIDHMQEDPPEDWLNSHQDGA